MRTCSARFTSELQSESVCNVLLHLVMLDNMGFLGLINDTLWSDAQLLTDLLTVEPTKRTPARTQKGGVFVHLLHFNSDFLFFRDIDSFILELICLLIGT